MVLILIIAVIVFCILKWDREHSDGKPDEYLQELWMFDDYNDDN